MRTDLLKSSRMEKKIFLKSHRHLSTSIDPGEESCSKWSTIWNQIACKAAFHIDIYIRAQLLFIPFFLVSVLQTPNLLVNGELSQEDWETGCSGYSVASVLCTGAIVFYTLKTIFSNLVTYYIKPSFSFRYKLYFSLNFSFDSFQQRIDSCAVLFLRF